MKNYFDETNDSCCESDKEEFEPETYHPEEMEEKQIRQKAELILQEEKLTELQLLLVLQKYYKHYSAKEI